ncbi:hypothetical protein HNV11_04920 [Spirosoma taeanense]|uniref:Uncharacterized protein n=1 Tax=Spirosoma taeanense TaxID=2735870 RepID=A0A6M5Y4M9_9BACT|nr:hypothetical protein [Spirosoma taeanense]QJW88769.1 hypothetical protein HNV11_04920 [Spirosoma taeanense]
MKRLSGWASRHTHLAIGLLVIGELANAANGLLLGANLLDTVSPTGLHIALIGLLTGAVSIRIWAAGRPSFPSYRSGRLLLALAFLSNFLLFILLGGIWGQSIQTPDSSGSAFGSRRITVVSDTLALPVVQASDSLYAVSRPVVAPAERVVKNRVGQRIGYVLLFVLGILLTYGAAALACNIACSGYGFLAAVTFMLGLGFLAGGIYFLSRSLDRELTPLQSMAKPDRKRITRRFWQSWLILIGLFCLLMLISNFSA